MPMNALEMLIYVLVLGGLSLVIAYLCVCLPNLIKRKPPKRHHYEEPASDDYKKSARVEAANEGSSVDHDKALSSFNR